MKVEERSNTVVLQVMRQTKRGNILFQESLYPDCFVYSKNGNSVPKGKRDSKTPLSGRKSREKLGIFPNFKKNLKTPLEKYTKMVYNKNRKIIGKEKEPL